MKSLQIHDKGLSHQGRYA